MGKDTRPHDPHFAKEKLLRNGREPRPDAARKLGVPKMKHAAAMMIIALAVPGAFAPVRAAAQDNPAPVDIGSRRELFWDDALLDTARTTAVLTLHHPRPAEVVMVSDEPWEGDGGGYYNLLNDDGLHRMYYLAGQQLNEDGTRLSSQPMVVCYAESRDGRTWVKPRLGICEFRGMRENNILLDGGTALFDNFSVFKDANPACPPEERYKGVGVDGNDHFLWCFTSADGIHFAKAWRMTDKGKFDTLNIAFWDRHAGQYRCYIRDFHNVPGGDLNAGIRDVRWMVSADFREWSDPVPLDFRGADDYPLYTNAVQPYYRADHVFVGFPSRYVERGEWTGNYDQLPGAERRRARMQGHPRFGLAVTDCVFMSSRDGASWKRWDEAFMTPGPEEEFNWVYGDCYPAVGMIETANDRPGLPNEISMYAAEGHWSMRHHQLRRHTLRVDGFVSLRAPYKPAMAVTKPFIFSGKTLSLNFATSAMGYVRIKLVAADRTLESAELFGDTLDRNVPFPGGDLAALAGAPVVMEITLRDADLYSFKFNGE